ncbi:family 16 glycosylhydrolase [Bradyrhizobium sp. STM 3561]|uniref:glycoside hydrolase family 16 protein n=1 Tax=Bradyrhizobium sp. STM 3561 TaxID=578923 RepID=UPI00388F5B14
MHRFFSFVLALFVVCATNAMADSSVGRDLPKEVLAQGYIRLSFEDDFSELNLDAAVTKRNPWYNALWYQEPNPLDQIYVSKGILALTTPPGTTETSITTVPRRGPGGATFHHGFFEARMRFANDELDWSAFWLFSRPHSLGIDDNHWCEIDVFENFGPNLFVGSVHDWTSSSHVRNKNARQKLPYAVDFSVWHNYGLLWTPDKLTWFLDSVPVLEATPPQICETQEMFMVLGSNKHKDGPLHKLEVDWVRVLSR